MTIDVFNKLTGHETLHPQICMIDLSKTNLSEDIRIMCDFYGLLSEAEQSVGKGMVTADLSRRGDRDTLEATPACRLLFGCAFPSRSVVRHIT